MKVGLLGLQGAFLDHIRHLKRLGIGYHIVKNARDMEKVDRLIIPGGESTVMEKFIALFNMTEHLRISIIEGLPVWGICAGSIILASKVDGRPGILDVLPVSAERNAYGRQLESSIININVPELNRPEFPAMFIRAPRLQTMAPAVKVLSKVGDEPVFVRYNRIMTTTFHPELTRDLVFHEYFIGL